MESCRCSSVLLRVRTTTMLKIMKSTYRPSEKLRREIRKNEMDSTLNRIGLEPEKKLKMNEISETERIDQDAESDFKRLEGLTC